MARLTPENIRNIALLGHAAAGKTTLAECLLHRSGAIDSLGTIARGNTVCDFIPQEKQQQHSLETTLCSFDRDGHHINMIDTPGYPDFIGRTMAVLPAVETAAVVINAQNGIEMMTRRIMDAAAERHLCRVIIINKIDIKDCDLAALLTQIQEAFGPECLPLNLPAADDDSVVDCFFEHGDQATAFSSVEDAHTAIVDQVVEVDEELMQLYLEQGEELTPEQLHAPFEKALREGHLIPVCFVSATSGAGINELLEIFSRLMPNPLESNPPEFLKGEGDDATPVIVEADNDKHLLAHVFKVTVDPFVGRLAIFRIHQGKLSSGNQLFIGDARKPFTVNNLLKLQGKQHSKINHAIAGDICAVAKVEDIFIDAVLHDSHDEDHFHMRPLAFPPPMHGVAVETNRRGDEQKLSDTLHKLDAEDPGLRLEFRAALNETVLFGASDLHLRAVLDKMASQYHVEVETHPPSIAYKETITAKAEGHSRHKKQSGGAGQFGEVFLKVEPLARGKGFDFVNQVVGGAIPRQFIPAVEKGIIQTLESGAVAGFPLEDIRVTVYDGKHHAVDSKEIAFVAAGKKAFLNAISNAKPIILEPLVDMTVSAPDKCMGDITGQISSRRGEINGSVSLENNRVEISAKVPLAELDNYQSQLKSITEGEGSFSMAFSHYDTVPPQTQQQMVEAFQPHDDND